jgi:hypothetical protein
MLVHWQGDMSAGQFSTKLTLWGGRLSVNLSGGLFILQSKLDFIVSGYDKSMDIVEHVNEAVQSQEMGVFSWYGIQTVHLSCVQ